MREYVCLLNAILNKYYQKTCGVNNVLGSDPKNNYLTNY